MLSSETIFTGRFCESVQSRSVFQKQLPRSVSRDCFAISVKLAGDVSGAMKNPNNLDTFVCEAIEDNVIALRDTA